MDDCSVALGAVLFDTAQSDVALALQKPHMAAGALLIQEAGGLVADLDGEDRWLESGDICAATPKILVDLLHKLRP